MSYTQGTVLGPSIAVGIDTRPINSAIVSTSAPCALWGGMAITASTQEPFGFSLQLAPTVVLITGFSVFTEADAMVFDKRDPVPQARPGGSINFVNLGSGAQVVLRAAPAVLRALRGAPVDTPVGWDFRAQQVVVAPGAGLLPIQSIAALLDDALVVVGDGRAWERGPAVVVVA
jgi:hypothetical protein